MMPGDGRADSESPEVRGEVNGSVQMSDVPREVAPASRAGVWLLAHLDEQRKFLESAWQHFRTAEGEEALSHAAEWLLDNFHVAQQTLRQIREDMSPGFYRRLPVLVSGPFAGLPRIYDIAQRLVSSNSTPLDIEKVRRFITLYQDETALTSGELWALPVMLRLTLVNVLVAALAPVTGLARGPVLPSLPVQGEYSPDELVGAAFTGLRMVATTDWQRFFETVSRVEAILSRDPARIYPRMDRETRNQYRRAVERAASALKTDEQTVAKQAVALAETVAVSSSPGGAGPGPVSLPQVPEDSEGEQPDEAVDWLQPLGSHVGYYLIDAGRPLLRKALRPSRPTLAQWGVRRRHHPTRAYLGPVLLGAALLVAAALGLAARAGSNVWQLLALLVLAIVPALTVAVAAVDWVVTLVVPPRNLPKLDFDRGIPDPFRTLVAVPSLLASEADVQSLLEQLEIYYLGNPDPNLAYALLTDMPDADQQEEPGDRELIELARTGIRSLNARYDRQPLPPFYLFHRSRRWNAREGRWMGWERKRGKLHELNRLLRGARDTSFTVFEGALQALQGVRYVITLDADTVLPRDAAQRLVSTIAHPLNRAIIDDRTGRVRRGYGILQPRTEVTPRSGNASLFSRVFSGDVGLDLYTRAVSNVYQDLFGTGIYVGKGIYDVDAFERSLEGRVPENTLLSHDLFEGVHARVGLVSDIVVYEDFPPSYLAYARRLQRWTRGDWQLLPWLLPRIAGVNRPELKSAFSLIDLWKFIDNLRRSLLPVALLLLLAIVWLWLPVPGLAWTLAALTVPAVPVLLGALTPVVRAARGFGRPRWSRSLRDDLTRWLFVIVFLPFEALTLGDAILRTLVRVLITGRRLLEWTTAAVDARQFGNGQGRRQAWDVMRFAVVVPLVLATLLVLLRPERLWIALPLLIAWLVAPEVADRISRTARAEPEPLSPDDLHELNALARRTWLFFERFVGPDDHWLPPDHFQEAPRGVAAPYTSPTNIGMLLLSSLAAYDLGYIGFPILVTRLQYTFDVLAQLERHRGHFLNWYDTRSLEPLPPRYISTVDSGNLAASLIVLKQGLTQIPRQKVLRWVRWEGLANTYALLEDTISQLRRSGLNDEAAHIQEVVARQQEALRAVKDQPAEWWNSLDYAAGPGWQELDDAVTRVLEGHAGVLQAPGLNRLRIAIEAIRQQIFTLRRFVNLLLPWLPLFNEAPGVLHDGSRPGVAALYSELVAALDPNPVLSEHPEFCRRGRTVLARLAHAVRGLPSEEANTAGQWCGDLSARLTEAEGLGEQFLAGLRDLAKCAEDLWLGMDFEFLFEPLRQVFHIGYNISAGRLDDNYYDLLASEARIASIVALAKHDVPRSHWLHLARPVTQVNGHRALLSWSATMFEYLMPRLLMRSTPGTLLFESESAAVEHQIRYTRSRGLPWGISESGYHAFDANQNYQYRAFGVPGLGFKRDLAEDLVVAPYASVLALAVRPAAVVENIRSLVELGGLGVHGLYEAIDFTPARLALGQDFAVVKEYMAHHQGMILLAIANRLLGDRMVERFHGDPRIRSVELLLEEKVPVDAPLELRPVDGAPDERIPEARSRAPAPHATLPWSVSYTDPAPEVHYLSNGRLSTLITAAGGGYSHWQGVDLTRWRADTTLDNWGAWIYVQDGETGDLWSAAYQPSGFTPGSHAEHFHPHMAEFRRSDHGIGLTMEVTIAPEEDVEIRRLTLVNDGEQTRRLVITSYFELVMAAPGGDNRHPAFNKLFIESEYEPDVRALLFRRRPRSAAEPPIFVAHLAADEAGPLLPESYETDRAAFLGRGRNARRPAALGDVARPLGRATGSTLDPIAALRVPVELQPGERKQFSFLTAAGDERSAVLAALNGLASGGAVDSAFEQARARAEVELVQAGLTTVDLHRMQSLLAVLLYPHPGLRADPSALSANTKGQPGLWPHAISGDYPILLVRVRDEDALGAVSDLLRAQTYWRRRMLKIDLVILIDQEAGYSQELRDELFRLLTRMQVDIWLNQRGGVFLLHTPQLPEPDLALILSAARAVVDPAKGSLAMQLEVLRRAPAYLPEFEPDRASGAGQAVTEPVTRPQALAFDNGLGGFAQDGREYVLYLEPGVTTPAPWVNVLANPGFGCLVSESGSSYTWAVNSGENRLTPWSNDPVTDPSGETLYLRDEETGEIWSPTPLPCPAPAPYVVRHGQGYTVFEHNSHGLRQRLEHFVAPDDPVKVLRLRVDNPGSSTRRVTATFYVEWVLGVTREAMQQYVISEYDGETQTLLVRNPYNAEFGERVAFVTASKRLHGVTTDRTEFLGRLGRQSAPAGLTRIGLSGALKPGADPCAALQVHLDLHPGESEEIWFVLGQGQDREESIRLAESYKTADRVAAAWQQAQAFWDRLLASVQVRTPDPGLDILLNRWLPYQALSCRIWGRAAFYQSSGAFGFRDQLQDVMAMLHAAPEVAREQILLAAGHQFEAGDVLHWWHPPSGRGVRTRCSDDLLWLPFVTAEYIAATGDVGILDEHRPFLRAAPLEPGVEERYGQFAVTSETYSLLEHCRRALEKGSTSGAHDLPLMGTGDWNDGMNRVGIEGRGESVWLGWFLYATLTRFAEASAEKVDEPTIASWRKRAAELAAALHEHAWDGSWYLRAFYDDGSPLGSAENRECRIDSIAQSWAVLSGGAPAGRARKAMDSVRDLLIRPEDQLILLFTPPFDQTQRDPGYIKGYVPGIRENGGQYTHAALWTVWALAELGDGDTATGLFRMLNPIYHAATPEDAARYKVEPYVVAADVYGVVPHTGRGGWTWYTGSSGWMYRLGLEAILGVRRRGDSLLFNPRIPSGWEEYSISYRFGGSTVYRILVRNSAADAGGSVVLDGQELPGLTLPFADDGREHEVVIQLGR